MKYTNRIRIYVNDLSVAYSNFVLKILEKSLTQIKWREYFKIRDRDTEVQDVLYSDLYKHLDSNHQFRNFIKQNNKSFYKRLLSPILLNVKIIFQYQLKFIIVVVWMFRKRKEKVNQFCIIEGLGYQHINQFIPFSEIIESLPKKHLGINEKSKLSFMIISSTHISTLNIKNKKNIFIALLNSQTPQKMSLKNLIKLLALFQALFFMMLIKNSLLPILNDIPELILTKFSENPKNKTILICTQGNFNSNSLIYYLRPDNGLFSTFMIHYSEGGLPFTSTQKNLNTLLPRFENAPVSTHIVWTPEYAHFYNQRSTNKNFMACGPQIFRANNKSQVVTRDSKRINIIIFDETPSYYDEIYEHLQEDAGIDFLDAIKFASDETKNLNFIFKQKRRNLAAHSRNYLMKLEMLSLNSSIKLLHWHSNPYDLIRSSNGVLTVLGSSPALIGRYLKIPTRYGYFGNKELTKPLVDYKIPVITKKEDLVTWALSLK